MTNGHNPYNHNHIWERRRGLKRPVWGSFSEHLYRRVLGDLAAPYLHPEGGLLDIGCGAGAFGQLVTQHGMQYVGVDESSVAIELGKQAFPTLGLFHIDLVVPGAAIPGLEPSSCAVVSLLNVLHCLPLSEQRGQVLKNALRYLRHDGVLILTNMVGPVRAGYRSADAPRVYLTPAELRRECQEAGFTKFLRQRYYPKSDKAPIPNIEWVMGAS